MSTRAHTIMIAAGASRVEMALALACDTSTISRLLAGRPETPPQAKLLDFFALERGLPHLTAKAFAAGEVFSTPASPSSAAAGATADPLAAPSGDGEGVGPSFSDEAA